MSRYVDWRVSVGLVGTVYRYLTVPLALPVGAALLYGESPLPFLVAMVVAAGWGRASSGSVPTGSSATARRSCS